MLTPIAFRAATFGAAFLLFLVQPLIGRWLLPVFGGTPAVWSTCLVFFQAALFAGYLWAHLGSRLLSLRAHAICHAVMVVLVFAALMLWPLQLPAPPKALPHPQLWVLSWLVRSIGPAFVVLAATAPLLQRWWLTITGKPPYKLYALSNAGSLLALVSYPVVFERWVSLPLQAQLWRGAYVVFALMLLGAAGKTLRVGVDPERIEAATVTWGRRCVWLGLAAVPTLLLVAVTNHITIDVASGPLLWVLPLLVYLASFILVFGPLQSRGRAVFAVVWVVCVGALGMNLFLAGKTGLLRQILVATALLFSGCMLCHGELVRLRPPASALTSFYLWMSGGGALGGVLGALVAPAIFVGFFELQVAVLLVFVVLFASHRSSPPVRLPRIMFVGVGVGIPLMLASIWLGTVPKFRDAQVLWRQRGFFGLVQVTQFADVTVLTHGRIRHGMQWNDVQRRNEPTMYFARETAVGQVLANLLPNRPRRVAVLGLGVGTLASYARPGDHFLFLEINPHVAQAAQNHFSFLRESAGHVEIKVGDGRSLMKQQAPESFDAVVLDAFSSDAVPTHLLTQEAFAIYRAVLAPNGVLVANVSNRHLSVERVVAGGMRTLGFHYEVFESASEKLRGSTLVRWIVAAQNAPALDRLGLVGAVPLQGSPLLWTDARSSVLSILR